MSNPIKSNMFSNGGFLLEALLVLTLGAALSPTARADIATSNGTHSVPSPAGDCALGEDCYRLAVSCTTNPSDPQIPLRFRSLQEADVVIRQGGPPPERNPVGGIVFFTGSYGTAFYGNGKAADASPSDETVTLMEQMGYTTFEVKWLDATAIERMKVTVPGNPVGGIDQNANPGHGFVSGSEGYGAKVSNCGVREVIEWISRNKTPPGPRKLCATGNSGGGMQIAYALSVYNAAEYLKSAVITGGPSYARIQNGCFDRMYTNGLDQNGLPDGTAQSMTLGFPGWHDGRQFLEANLGWGTSSCVRAGTYAVDAGLTFFEQATSLVPSDDRGIDVEYRNYAPRDHAGVLTNQFFVRGSLDNTGAQIQGNTYIDKVTAAGAMNKANIRDVYPADGGLDYLEHNIHNTPAGALFIQNFLTQGGHCTYAK